MGRRRVKVNPADHVGLVVNIAKVWAAKCNEPIEDLVQEGSIGLMRAAEKFDPKRGLKFSTYASWWIHASIRGYIKERGGTIHAPAHHKHAVPGVVSLDAPHATEGGQMLTLLDTIAATMPAPDAIAADSERAKILWRAVDRLDAKHRTVIRMRFQWGKTLREVGEVLGLSREGVRLIELEALALLRPYLERRLA